MCIIFIVKLFQTLCLKHCQNCKYYKISIEGGITNEICLKKYTYAKTLQKFERCDVARRLEYLCGKSGKFYEPLFNNENDSENVLFQNDSDAMDIIPMLEMYGEFKQKSKDVSK